MHVNVAINLYYLIRTDTPFVYLATTNYLVNMSLSFLYIPRYILCIYFVFTYLTKVALSITIGMLTKSHVKKSFPTIAILKVWRVVIMNLNDRLQANFYIHTKKPLSLLPNKKKKYYTSGENLTWIWQPLRHNLHTVFTWTLFFCFGNTSPTYFFSIWASMAKIENNFVEYVIHFKLLCDRLIFSLMQLARVRTSRKGKYINHAPVFLLLVLKTILLFAYLFICNPTEMNIIHSTTINDSNVNFILSIISEYLLCWLSWLIVTKWFTSWNNVFLSLHRQMSVTSSLFRVSI